MYQIISQRARPLAAQSDGQVNILVVVGGGKATLAQHPYLWCAHAGLTVDVASELSHRPSPLRDSTLSKSFSLAEGETAGTLFAVAGSLRERIDQLGDLNGSSGLGQLRLLGAQAADRLLKTAEFEEFIEQLLDHVQVVSRGRPRQVQLRAVCSEAGGTGSGACLPIVDRIARELTALEVPVAVDYDLLGPITFAGLGSRLGRNAAAATADFIRHFRSKGEGRERLITRNLSLIELPPMTHDQAARDALVLLDEQAQAGLELQQTWHRVEPNHAVSGPLGNITLRQVDYFVALPPQDVAAVIAEAYHLQVSQALDQARPCPALIREVRQTTEKQPLPHASLEAIAERALEIPVEETLAELRTPTEAYRSMTTVIGAQGEEYQADQVETVFAAAPTTLAAAHERLRLLRSMLRSIEREQAAISSRQAEMEAIYDELIERTKKSIGKLGGSWWTSLERRVDRFLADAGQLRETVNRLNELNAWLDSLTLAAHVIGREEQSLGDRLSRLLATLAQHRRKESTDSYPSPVLFRQINDAFGEMLDLDRHTPERQQWLLRLQASAVTVDGLAAVVGAQLPRLERIAERIVNGETAVAGPCWGGRHPQGEMQLVYALPPTVPAVADRLRELIRALDPAAITVFADSCSAGVSVLRYRFYRIDEPQDLFRGRLLRDLKEAVEEPNQALYFPHGVPAFLGENGLSA